MATKSIKGAQISATGGRPSGKWFDGGVVGHQKKVGNVKGGPNLGKTGKEGFFMGTQAHGKPTVIEARGKHLA